jgi:Type ISP C-terminal specificity domain/Eco57I restriction-modification methylase/N-6 DNA Methylase
MRGCGRVARRHPDLLQQQLNRAVSRFGADVAEKLRGQVGQPEAQLRAPFDRLLRNVAAAMGLPPLVPIDESPLPNGARLDYAIRIGRLACGHAELKAPGKGIHPRDWTARSRERQQWERLRQLPNLLYTDGQRWALYRGGVQVGRVAVLEGDVTTAGASLAVDDNLRTVLTDFLEWVPQAPETLDQLVKNIAGLCGLLRDEVRATLVAEWEGRAQSRVRRLWKDWQDLLFPGLNQDQFADAYAQTVTFALLLARAEGIDFGKEPSLVEIADKLGKNHLLMGRALGVLTDGWAVQGLTSTIDTLVRVIGAVEWGRLDDQTGTVYLRLYEDFLAVYDPVLRKKTGSYFTPDGVVSFMVRFVEDVLRDRFHLAQGFATPDLLTVDPAMGTGTFLIHIIRRATQGAEEGVRARLGRIAGQLVGFENQACPYAVAQLKVAQAMYDCHPDPPLDRLRLYLTNALDPFDEPHVLDLFGELQPSDKGALYGPIQESRHAANEVKRNGQVRAVISNPPYLEQATGRGSWIEYGDPSRAQRPPLDEFREEGVGRFEYKLANLYVYFWRMGTWLAFDAHQDNPTGIVAFITPSSYLSGPGFAGMRTYLRSVADEGWIIDVSPEGLRPPIPTRLFAGVSQPLCIGVFARYGPPNDSTPAAVHHFTVHGSAQEKLSQLEELHLDGAWRACGRGWRAPLTPAPSAEWSSFPAISDLYPWSSLGVTPNRRWVYAPDPDTLRRRWRRLVVAEPGPKRRLLKETEGRTIDQRVRPIPGFSQPATTLREERGPGVEPVRVGYRSFDRQWLIPDSRVIDRPRIALWQVRSDRQLYLTEPRTERVAAGPAVTFTANVPDTDHYRGHSGGRVFPLYRDQAGHTPNVAPGVLELLRDRIGSATSAKDLFAYVAGIAAHDGFTTGFAADMDGTGIRIPLTAEANLFRQVCDLGRQVLWLHSYGERFIDPKADRPPGPPRLPPARRPQVIVEIPDDEDHIPTLIKHVAASQTLQVGDGQVQPVPRAVWDYQVAGMRVVRHWFRYRTTEPTGRYPTELDAIPLRRWDDTMIKELLNLLNILGFLVELAPKQQAVLDQIRHRPRIGVDDLIASGAVPAPPGTDGPLLYEGPQGALPL